MIISDEWQLPAATEKETWIRLHDSPASANGLVMHYPWATLIDCCTDNYQSAKTKLWDLYQNYSYGMHEITCCQHIRAYQYSFLFAACGLRSIFWPHTTVNSINGYSGLRFYSYPLYPVQRPHSFDSLRDSREILVSFQGAYDSRYYLTPARQWLAEAPWQEVDDQKVCVEITSEWHFQKDVYDRQIRGKPLSSEDTAEKTLRESSYRSLLSNSLFTLCPSGTGPNSIRLWESIGFQSIPVVLADGLALPWADVGLPYDTGIISVAERKSSVMRLPSLLVDLSKDREFINRKRRELEMLWNRYWKDSFGRPILDHIKLTTTHYHAKQASPALALESESDFAHNLNRHFRGYLSYAATHQCLRHKWPTGYECIASFILDSVYNIDCSAAEIKSMLVDLCKKNKGKNPYILLTQLIDEVI